MTKKSWPPIHGFLIAPFCRTTIKSQYFRASSADRTRPLQTDNPQLPHAVFMASLRCIHPHFKAEWICLYFFLAFVHKKKNKQQHISRPMLLTASCFCCLVFCSYHDSPTSCKSCLVFCSKGKNRMISADFWSSCIIID